MQDFSSPFRRFAPSPLNPSAIRRGSVLIMVIAVLVLMALIATAYVSVARIDRQAAATGSNNTQSSLLTSGVAQQVDAMILNNLFATYGAQPYYRPATDNTAKNINIQTTFEQDPTATYHDYDSFYDDRDAWLASRVPQPLDVNTTSLNPISITYSSGGTIASAGNPVVWPSVSLLQTTPFTNANGAYTEVADPSNSALALSLNLNKRNYRFVPTWKKNATGANYPAMAIYTINVANNSSITCTALGGTDLSPLLAADADGDGIADSLYFKLTNQPDPNITYYAAVRIIDSNSAINASTAWSVTRDADGSQANPPVAFTPNPGVFASNVGLEEMLRDYTYTPTSGPAYSPEMDKLNQYRFNWATSPSAMASENTPASWTDITGSTGYAYGDPQQYTSNWVAKNTIPGNVEFVTYGDMLQMQLARRLDNPGYNNFQGAPSPVQFRALSWTDNAALADRFCIVPSNGASSIIEETLPTSLIDGPTATGSSQALLTAPYADPSYIYNTTPYTYPASSSTTPRYWFNDNFDYDTAEVTTASPRSWITIGATKTIGNSLSRRALFVGRDPVSDNVPWDTQVSWNPPNAGAQITTTAVGPVITTTINKPPCRANLNTSSFNDLYNGFLACMLRCETAQIANTPFNSTNMTNLGLAKNVDVQQLRAGLAAANTIAMRSSTYLTTYESAGTTAHQLPSALSNGDIVYTYGMAPQPFITQVLFQDMTEAGKV